MIGLLIGSLLYEGRLWYVVYVLSDNVHPGTYLRAAILNTLGGRDDILRPDCVRSMNGSQLCTSDGVRVSLRHIYIMCQRLYCPCLPSRVVLAVFRNYTCYAVSSWPAG